VSTAPGGGLLVAPRRVRLVQEEANDHGPSLQAPAQWQVQMQRGLQTPPSLGLRVAGSRICSAGCLEFQNHAAEKACDLRVQAGAWKSPSPSEKPLSLA